MRLPALLCGEVCRNPRLASASAMLLFALFPLVSPAQTVPKRALITQPVEESNLTVLRGNTYPLARAEYDRDTAPGSLPMQRMRLVLKRTLEQETAL